MRPDHDQPQVVEGEVAAAAEEEEEDLSACMVRHQLPLSFRQLPVL